LYDSRGRRARCCDHLRSKYVPGCSCG
jgi:hypothetical protein